MNHFNKKPVAIAVAATMAGMMAVGTAQAVKYEVWASDQANSEAGQTGVGKSGSLLWIWDSEGPTGVKAYLGGPSTGTQPAVLNCNGTAGPGPCDIHDIFPDTLDEFETTTGVDFVGTGVTLADVGPIARLHGAIPDPQNMYVNMNMFAGQYTTGSGTGNGFVGIMDADAKEAIALWRVTQTTGTSGGGRSLHMSFWNSTGSALLLANLHGRILERIDIARDASGTITGADFNQAASVGMGGNTFGVPITDGAKAYRGLNGAGNTMLGTVSGTYAAEATSLTFGVGTGVGTSNALTCKQKDCGVAGADPGTERPGNVIVCPIVTSNNLAFVTFGGGGLLVADTTSNPMEIVGAYDNSVINGAGCGGVEVGGFVYLNAGTSAASGADKSTSSMFKLSIKGFGSGFTTNLPTPVNVFQDGGNTGTLGAPSGGFIPSTNTSGQSPVTSTRSDAHGMTPTITGNYVHMDDRIQNEMVVFDSNDFGVSTYSLDGTAAGLGLPGGDALGADVGCATQSVSDGGALPLDDAAPDLMATGPENKYLFAALRGPNPVTVSFNAQGSCPGVGVISLDASTNGQSGTMTHVLETRGMAASSPRSQPSGGFDYLGGEFSDVHGVSLRIR